VYWSEVPPFQSPRFVWVNAERFALAPRPVFAEISLA
jgi:hypothetical protein